MSAGSILQAFASLSESERLQILQWLNVQPFAPSLAPTAPFATHASVEVGPWLALKILANAVGSEQCITATHAAAAVSSVAEDSATTRVIIPRLPQAVTQKGPGPCFKESMSLAKAKTGMIMRYIANGQGEHSQIRILQ